MSIKTLKCALVLWAFALFPTASSALLVDDFNEGPTELVANAANTMVQSVVQASGILGGEREATAIYHAPGSNALDNVRLNVDFLNQNNFSHSQDAGVAGLSIFVYDGMDGDASSIDFNGLGGIDLTQGGTSDGFLFSILFADQTVANVLDLRVYTSETEFSDLFVSINSPINSPTQLVLPYANFVLGNGATGMADFTNVNAILLAIDGRFEPALDIRLDSLETNPVIPEPATIGLLGFGLACLGVLRRRQSWPRHRIQNSRQPSSPARTV